MNWIDSQIVVCHLPSADLGYHFFVQNATGTKKLHHKSGTILWRRFLERVSLALDIHTANLVIIFIRKTVGEQVSTAIWRCAYPLKSG